MNSYKALNKQTFTQNKFSLVPIRDRDKFKIMNWRNEQIYHLRQNKPLTKESQENKLAYQKVLFYSGLQSYTDGEYQTALKSFEKAVALQKDATISARATFWKGESNYRLNNFKDALSDFNNFIGKSQASNTLEFEHVDYNIAYSYFKQKEYTSATDAFKKYISKNTDDEIRKNDSYLRIADGYFVNSNYSSAINYYNKAIETNGIDGDYAQFQKAICYGLTSNENLDFWLIL